MTCFSHFGDNGIRIKQMFMKVFFRSAYNNKDLIKISQEIRIYQGLEFLLIFIRHHRMGYFYALGKAMEIFYNYFSYCHLVGREMLSGFFLLLLCFRIRFVQTNLSPRVGRDYFQRFQPGLNDVSSKFGHSFFFQRYFNDL